MRFSEGEEKKRAAATRHGARDPRAAAEREAKIKASLQRAGVRLKIADPANSQATVERGKSGLWAGGYPPQGRHGMVNSESNFARGEMAEWLKAHAWKACLPQGNVGSNPTLSARDKSSKINGIRDNLADCANFVRSVQAPSLPIVTISVRHSSECPRKGDEFHKSCRCRKHLRWTYGGKQYRQSAKTRTWAIAEQVRRKIEAQFESEKPVVGSVTVEANVRQTIGKAIELFISDKRTQGVSKGVLKKYELELGRFSEFMSQRSKFFPLEITKEDLTEFRAGWEQVYPSSTTRVKVQERLRGFLRYCYEAKMIERVPRLSPIQVEEPPTLPLSDSQYAALLKAILKTFIPPKEKRVHALVQLMRYSGLAIRDAVTLPADGIQVDERKKL